MQRSALSALLALSFAGLALTGCLTPREKVAPSAAVLAARAGAGAKSDACRGVDLASVSPALATFPFDKAELDDVGTERVTAVAGWLACHPATEVVVIPGSDGHGDAAHQNDLASRRASAVTTALRGLGAKQAVVRQVALGAPDPLTGPHVLIRAIGRGW